ncbi:ATP-binding cassette-type vacuolar membrane transporter Hmt1 [Mycoemilia scoparia]|uniref:ATP-binding cassette-type vacuolar membrane transporter Hmt1 n=1 Tax=Mycoemilia scoparia TaxID=417184 RepID=A0A9W8DS04_9FUNG|nr:ATP-binding cassette-type vacuolar membrane transporter Hmt1 [Mycoemilia scoparia]
MGNSRRNSANTLQSLPSRYGSKATKKTRPLSALHPAVTSAAAAAAAAATTGKPEEAGAAPAVPTDSGDKMRTKPANATITAMTDSQALSSCHHTCGSPFPSSETTTLLRNSSSKRRGRHQHRSNSGSLASRYSHNKKSHGNSSYDNEMATITPTTSGEALVQTALATATTTLPLLPAKPDEDDGDGRAKKNNDSDNDSGIQSSTASTPSHKNFAQQNGGSVSIPVVSSVPPPGAAGDYSTFFSPNRNSYYDQEGNALRSGRKKQQLYHHSDHLYKGIRNIQQRLSKLLPFMWPTGQARLQLSFVGIIGLLACGRVVNVLVPLQLKRMVDALAVSSNISSPPVVTFEWMCIQIAIFVVLKLLQGSAGLIATAQNFMWIPVGQNTTKKISVDMFDHLHNLSFRFHINRKTGEILRVQDRGVASVVSILSSILFNIIPTFVDILLASYFFTIAFDLYFGLIVLVTMVSYITLTVKLTDWRTRYRRLANQLDNEMEARAVDSLLNFETVKYYNAEKFEGDEYAEAVDKYQEAEWKSTSTMNVLNVVQTFIIQVGLALGALLCAKRVLDGSLTLGDFTMYLNYIAQLYGPLNWFGTYYRVIQKNFIDMEKMFELFEEPIDIKDPTNPRPLCLDRGKIEFDKVSFSYDGVRPTLSNISFTIPPGATVALVGPSGSGKSTILRLLFRFYDVQMGSIRIDDQDIRDVPQREVRKAIGVVPQDTVLFNDTIRYNVAYGKAGDERGVFMDDVIRASLAAQIHDRILSFPDGYESKVGERGLRLSGGEKQRVAIARTILKDPAIVCLDEATSALDTHTERNIQASLREMTADRTTLIIAHRLSTVIHADMILVLKDGQIIERGTHNELLSNPESTYHDMWMKQLKDESSGVNGEPIFDTGMAAKNHHRDDDGCSSGGVNMRSPASPAPDIEPGQAIAHLSKTTRDDSKRQKLQQQQPMHEVDSAVFCSQYGQQDYGSMNNTDDDNNNNNNEFHWYFGRRDRKQTAPPPPPSLESHSATNDHNNSRNFLQPSPMRMAAQPFAIPTSATDSFFSGTTPHATTMREFTMMGSVPFGSVRDMSLEQVIDSHTRSRNPSADHSSKNPLIISSQSAINKNDGSCNNNNN